MKRSLLLEKIKQHSRRVLITKRSLPVFAFLMASLIITWPFFNQNKDKFTLAVPAPDQLGAKVEMENLRFFGLNEKKLPMTLQAPSMKEDPKNPELAKMQKPVATYKMNQGDTLLIKSPYALVDQKKQTVFFEDRVFGTTDSNYVIKASQILFDYNTGTADSDSPVSVVGPDGRMNAQGVWMANKGDLILFKKKATTMIKNKNNKIHVSAKDGIQIDQKQKTITAKQEAIAIQDEVTLKADKLILYYTDNTNNRIQKIEAFGHVRMDNKKQTMTGQEGFYHPQTNKAEMRGNVVLSQGMHHLKSDKAVLNLKTGESDLISNKRITGQLMPNHLKGE